MSDFITVIIPTFNPNRERLRLTIEGLKNQTLATHFWELIIVDNNSSNRFEQNTDLSWHPAASILKENRQGLTFARLKGFVEAKGNYIVMIDDDNVIEEKYLEQALHILKNNPEIGCAGGISEPIFASQPPQWLSHFYENLALRNYGSEVIIEKWSGKYPQVAPIGAGMVVRKEALANYIGKILNSAHIIADRKGNSLSSGGDNDIVLEIIRAGWAVGYFPQLCLKHIIPHGRMQVDYMARLVYDSNISWVRILENHGINPWKKIYSSTLLPRYIKAWFKNSAWRGGKNYIMWKSDCGLYKGLAEID